MTKRPTRCLVRMPIHVQLVENATHVFLRATTSNLNATGMYIKGVLSEGLKENPPRIGTALSLQFVLPGSSLKLKGMAEVVWVNPQDRDSMGHEVLGVGVRFVKTDAVFKKSVESFIEDFRYQILLVDDEVENLELVERVLKKSFRVLKAQTAQKALDFLENQDVAAIIVDQCLPDMSGIDLLRTINDRYSNLPIARIVLTAHGNPDVIREFINVGKVCHFFDKPVEPIELEQVVDAAAKTYALVVENERLNAELLRTNETLVEENVKLRESVDKRKQLEQIIGHSSVMREVLTKLEQVAGFPTTVHIRGETGTGKELVARALHYVSPRKRRPFVAFNCAGVPETLVQSTLFGHLKGAFTGAVKDQKGLFEEASTGTVFLDEIGDLTATVQMNLLRVLQEREIVPLGATGSKKVDVRVVSATNRDLKADVKAGRFREDLYYRLVVFEIELPPLRERLEDVSLLADHFLKTVCEQFDKRILGFTPECMASMEAYAWPGNVRELENEVKRAVIRAPEGQHIDVLHLSPNIKASDPTTTIAERYHGLSLTEAVQDTEKRLIEHALEQSNQVVAKAAEILGVEPSTLRKKIKRLNT